MISYDSHGHGRPQTFFQGSEKIFQGGGQEPTFCQKTTKKILFSSKKCKKHTILVGQAQWFHFYIAHRIITQF